PAAHVSGEIVAPPPTVEPDQPDGQPSIVFDEAAGDSDAHARTGSADPESAAVRAIPDAHADPDPDAPAEAGGGASDTDDHVRALRVLAATVSISHDPAHIARDLLVGDTKPERLLGRPRPAEDTGSPGEELEITIIHDSPPADSGATTARIAVPVLPDAAASAAAASAAAPAAITDEPSDGVVRHPIATAETAPVRRRRMLTEPPEDDRPEDAVGEITAPRVRVTAEPRMSEPSILVPDLAVIHAEVSASVSEQVTAPVLVHAASSALEPPVAPVPSGADSLREVEETFFGADHDKDATGDPAPSRPESFDDLDQGYRPVGFWDRLRGKGTRRPDTPVPPDPPDPQKPGDKQS
ncbi:MAG TPA: hypothetical protein VHN14_14545, partial [Kofleriaceae bacterium]|nr:hypothetical protein [Kofleriaceae bacterium]